MATAARLAFAGNVRKFDARAHFSAGPRVCVCVHVCACEVRLAMCAGAHAREKYTHVEYYAYSAELEARIRECIRERPHFVCVSVCAKRNMVVECVCVPYGTAMHTRVCLCVQNTMRESVMQDLMDVELLAHVRQAANARVCVLVHVCVYVCLSVWEGERCLFRLES